MKNVYQEKYAVDDTNIDHTYQVPITEIVKLVERVAFNHANQIELDHKTMEEKSNAFWIITKMKLVINAPINATEKLVLKTWTHTPNLVRFKRDFTIKSAGKLKVKGVSEWCCLDMSTHKIRKASSLNYPNLEMIENKDVKTDFSNLKTDVTSKDYVYTHTVRSTDIDVNFHTNNIKYNFMTLNAFTVEEMRNLTIKEYELYFVNESHEGDKIDIYKKLIKNCFYVEGNF